MTAALANAPAITAPQSGASKLDPSSQSLLAERSAIDATTSGPVLFFFGTSILWLLLASLLGLISSIQLHSPTFLADIPIFTYGRLVPVYNQVLGFGWAMMSGMGAAIWMLARLCRVEVKFPRVLVAGGIFWQVGLLLGIYQILIGKSTGVEGLELPGSAVVVMLIGYLLIALWGGLTFGYRRESPAYISVWYIITALFWFPWTLAIGYLSLQLDSVQGVMQSIVAAWAVQNFFNVVITALGLAMAYYLIPKVVNRPIHNYGLASTGFWAFLLFSGLTGMVRLSGGPVPVWLVTLSISSTILLLIQTVTVSANLLLTMRGEYHLTYYSPTIRFTAFGVIAFALACVIALLTSLRSVDRILHFTFFQSAQNHLLLYAFFSMVMFGAIYYIVPRLVGCEWLSSSMISYHFWASAYGGGLLIGVLGIGGIAFGTSLANPGAMFSQVIQSGAVYYIASTIAWGMLLLGHLIFALHFLLMACRIGQPAGEATLFAPIGEEKH